MYLYLRLLLRWLLLLFERQPFVGDFGKRGADHHHRSGGDELSDDAAPDDLPLAADQEDGEGCSARGRGRGEEGA